MTKSKARSHSPGAAGGTRTSAGRELEPWYNENIQNIQNERVPFLRGGMILQTSGGIWFVLVPMVGYPHVQYVVGLVVVACMLLAAWVRVAVRSPWSASVLLLVLASAVPYLLQELALEFLPPAVLDDDMCRESTWIGNAWHRQGGNKATHGAQKSSTWQSINTRGILGASDCAEIAQTVLAHPDKFVYIRNWGVLFFTSGVHHGYMGTYGTGVVRSRGQPRGQPGPLLTNALSYAEGVVSKTQFWLSQTFGSLHEEVRTELEQVLSSSGGSALAGPVTWMPHMGRPGFHVIYSHAAFSWLVFTLHTDQGQLGRLTRQTWPHVGLASWPVGKLCDFESQIAFTLPVQLPNAECGLDYVSFSGCNETEQRCTSCVSHHSALYEVGTLYVHSGGLVHQIRPWSYSSIDAARPRITLQGFGVRCNGMWYLYW